MGLGSAALRLAKKPAVFVGALSAPDAIDKGKMYKRRLQTPMGAQPVMNKISARKALRHYLKKEAAGSTREIAGMMATGLAIGVGSQLAGRAVGGAARGVGDIFLSFRNNRLFEELKTKYPEIKSNKRAREYFDMIMAYAPSLARHPTAIGDFLSRQLQYPVSSIEFLHRLADFEGSVRKTDASRASTAFGDQVAESAGRAGAEALRPKKKGP